MTDPDCSCCGGGGETDATSATGAAPPTLGSLDEPLPGDIQEVAASFFGREDVETLRGVAEACQTLTDGDTFDLEDLCHAGEPTDHWGDVGDDRYYFRCFFDALALPTMRGQPVEITTKSPDGTTVEATLDPTGDHEVVPETAVTTLGVDTEAAASVDGTPSLEDAYAAFCPYTVAFPDRDAYEEWAETVPAATVAISFADGVDLARAFLS